MTTLWQDVRYGFRMLCKNPGFTAIALVTLAIGIGANTIMFSLVNAMLFRSVHVQDPDRLVVCKDDNLDLGYEMYTYMRDHNPVFSDLVALDRGPQAATLVWGDVSKRAHVMYVSSNYFSALGVAPARGRYFLPEEERLDAELVAVLSHRLWQRQGADPEIVGQRVSLNGMPAQVVGVAPEGFTGATLVGPELWLPLGSGMRVQYQLQEYPLPQLMGRLRPGLSMSGAQAQLQSLIPRLRENFPRSCNNHSTLSLNLLPRTVHSTQTEGDRAYLSGASLFLMGVSAVILLIACTNLANMIVIHGITRHREIAIRLAVGGSRWYVVRQLFVESLLVALLGGGLGIVLAIWCMRVLNAWVAALDPEFPLELARVLTTGLDLRVLAATLGICLTATVLFGLKPALRLSRRDVVADLKESAGGGVMSTRSTRGIMPRGLSVVFQTALSVVLVMAAVLCTRSARKAIQTNPGFDLQGKLLIEIDARAAGYDPARSVQVCEAVAEHLNALPGVQMAGLSCDGGFGGSVVEYAPGVESDTPGNLLARDPFVCPVGGEYFESMGIPLLQGRTFCRLDSVTDAEKVLIIDEPLARRLRPDANALGCLIQYGWRSLSEPHRIVGIVPTLHSALHNPEKRAHIYLPMGPKHRPAYIHLRLASDALNTEATLRQMIPAEIRKVDPYLPVLSVRTLMDCQRNDLPVWLRLMGARLSLIFGAMALFLAALGIYAVKGYMVASRTPEIGVRMALGATRRGILAMVLREGAILTLVGLCWGLLLAWAVARVAGSLLYGVSPLDPVSIAVTIVVLGLASLLASYIPARRAARVDPMAALRYE